MFILFGEISNKFRNVLYNAADMFIMPNITVPGDMEGFGIVALEAGSCGLPVIAADIEGIRDAVIDGKTGFLIEEEDAEGFLERIRGMSLQGADVRRTVASRFNWQTLSMEYFRFLFSLNS